MPSVYFDPDLPDDEQRRRLYAGDIIIVSATQATREFISFARELLEEAFAPYDPRSVHDHLPAERTAEILAVLKPKFIHDPRSKQFISQIMAERGIDRENLYFDVPRLRSAYPSDYLSAGIAYAFHPHRDTWYSAPFNQLNWWLPIYPIEPGNAMAFYPKYFDRPVLNNSEIYNYYEWNTKFRADAAKHIKQDLREQPKPLEVLDQDKICFLPPPGGIILFSGAQLHETVPNSTGMARYSIDFRTVHKGDAEMRIGASNIDSRCTGTTMRDYLSASDYKHFPEEIVRLYDDATATEDKVLYYGGTPA